MAMKRRKSGKELPMAGAIAIGIFGSLILTFLGAALLAYLIGKGSVMQSGISFGCMIILAASSSFGAFLASGLFKRRKLMVCGITAAGYYLSLLAMTAMFFEGQYNGLGITAIMVLLGAGTALLPVLLGKGKKTKHKIPAYR